MEILQNILTMLSPLIEAYAGNFGWAVAIVAYIGTFRLFFKPVFAAISVAVKESPSTKDDEVLAKVESNVFFKAFVFVVDLFASIKIKPKS